MVDPDDLSQLPEDPGPEELLTSYKLCREKLVAANRSRSSLSGHNTRRYKAIRDLQSQLEELERDFRSEAASRMRVHELNERVAEIVRELETGIDQSTEIINERSTGKRSDWVARIARLVKAVFQLHKLRQKASELLGRRAELEPLVFAPPRSDQSGLADGALDVDIVDDIGEQPIALPPAPQVPVGPDDLPADQTLYGQLILQSVDGAYGLLVLHQEGEPVPQGLTVVNDAEWISGSRILVPEDPDEPDYAPIEAGILVVDTEEYSLPALQTWLNAGLLPFRLDRKLNALRLLPLDRKEVPSHLLIRKEKAAQFDDIGSQRIVLEFDQHNWLGFLIATPDEQDLFVALLQNKAQRDYGPRLSTRGGVLLPDRQGFLASGLGLPSLGIPAPLEAQAVRLELADGSVLSYVKEIERDESNTRKLWRPSAQDRRRLEIQPGSAQFTASFKDETPLSRTIRLNGLEEETCFRRTRPIDHREDWGVSMGPVALTSDRPAAMTPSEDALRWAQQRLRDSDLKVNLVFEQQMLETLSVVFQRRPSIQRHEFFEFYTQLRNKPDEWPRFTDAVLRAWCEGGWLEEGVERGHGAWRIQPVDPRLVRLPSGGLQLIGLLSVRRLVRVIATAHQLGATVHTVLPTCSDLPRGWRFMRADETLGDACGLPVVGIEDWVGDPAVHDWVIRASLPSDSPPWPQGSHCITSKDSICGRRGLDYHWKTSPPLPEGGRAPINLKIEAEVSRYGRRRWYSRDPDQDSVFVSCHRNRAAMHALIVATNGLWPFGFTDYEAGQLDRLYDADAYLPLPLARYTALTGSKMPGPTRLRPQDHTYRYHLNRDLRLRQSQTRLLPLTSLP